MRARCALVLAAMLGGGCAPSPTTDSAANPAADGGLAAEASNAAPRSPDFPLSPTDAAFEQALTAHRGERYLGTLEEIQRRGVLRVAMLNNAVSYFIYRGQEVGFQYEMAELLAARLSVRLQVVVPPRPSDTLLMLDEGRADVIAVGQGTAVERPDLLLTSPFVFANQVLVQRTADAPVRDIAGLAGKAVHLRRSSDYRAALLRLQEQVPSLTLVDAPETSETEDLIDEVARGVIPMTAANALLLGVERTYRDDVQGTLVLAENQGLVYAVAPPAKTLAERLQRFVERDAQGPPGKQMYAKYFESSTRMAELQLGSVGASGALSPYDDLVRRHAQTHDLDWRLVLAQMYQESRFDPAARSWAGALGLLQLMPATAKELRVDPTIPEQNIEGGVRYLRSLIDRYEPELDMKQRVRFALASYNAGYYHVDDARQLARHLKLDPNRWFGQVEKAIVLLEKSTYHRRARFGYCRGREPVAYVSRIQSKYEGFVALTGGRP